MTDFYRWFCWDRKPFPRSQKTTQIITMERILHFLVPSTQTRLPLQLCMRKNKWYFPISLLPSHWESGTFRKQESWIVPSYLWESFNDTVLIQSCFWYLGNQTHNLCLCRGSKCFQAFLTNVVCLFLPKDIITILSNFILWQGLCSVNEMKTS